jgi:hypothetical protein
MGWYGGTGARKVLGPITRTGVAQPMPQPDPVTGRIECNWIDPYTITIPNTSDHTDWASGVYREAHVRWWWITHSHRFRQYQRDERFIATRAWAAV